MKKEGFLRFSFETIILNSPASGLSNTVGPHWSAPGLGSARSARRVTRAVKPLVTTFESPAELQSNMGKQTPL